ncbi:MAG: PAS domain S-box protein [Xenococcaceae cyanobacterium]
MSDNQFNNNQPRKLELTDEKAEKTKQQELITEVALRIRQSLNLQDILEIAVREVQNILDCDRVIVYRFAADMSGNIVAESVKPGWKKSLSTKVIDTCFQTRGADKYERGETLAINDVYTAQLSQCHLDLLAEFQVKANAIVPILPTPSLSNCGTSRLWGLLIAHHCHNTHQWQEEEIELLDELALQLAIAIKQAELLQNLQIELEQRKQAEQALRESEARFYSIFQSAAIGMAVVSLEGRWLVVNPALCKMVGYSQAELQQTTFQAITYPDDLDRDLTYIDMLLERYIPHFQMEKRYIHKQGKLVWINLSVSLVRDELNQPLYFVTLLENITQRKQAEQALKESEEEFRSLVSNIPGVIYRCQSDSYWTMDFISDAIEGICGYKATDFIGNQVRSYASIIHPKDQDYVGYVINQALAARKSFVLEYRIICEDDSLRWVYEKGKGVFDDYGNILYLNGAIFDISDRQQAEQALRESEQRYRNLYNNTPVMLHSIDSIGRIISVSNYWLEYLGYEESEVIGKKYWEFLTEESRLYAQEVILPQFLKTGTCTDVPYKFICKNGIIIDVLLSSIAETDNSGTVIASLAVMIDVTKRNQAEAAIQEAKNKLHQANLDLEQRVEERTEELLEAKEAAETANQAKDHFLAHISHELRTPLNSILGFTQILQKDLNLNENQQQNIQLIRQSGKHLLTLINDILDFSKITAQKLVLEPQDFCFSTFLDELTSLMRQQAQQTNLSFNYQLLSNLPNAVHGDETRLKQVLINLLGNALKFTPEGSVSLRVGYVKDFGDRQADSSKIENNHKIRFEVEDTGIGIPEEKLEKIFLPFEQISNNLANKKGTGLGLTITDNILQLMDSKIQVKSTLGTGSVFCFELDLPSVDSEIVCAPLFQMFTPIGFRGERRKILIVDDVPANIHLLSSLLKPLGFEIAEAKNGQEGLEIARSFKPDAMLIDLVMPVMNGIEMANKVREDRQLRGIIMIAISANVKFSDGLKFDRELFTTFLSKPIDLNQLLNLLGDYLQLEWIENENNENNIETSTESLVLPPIEIIEELLNLSKLGDMNEIITKTTLLKQSDEQYSYFAQRVEQLASNYEQNNLLKLLENFQLKNRSGIESGF